MGKLEQKVAVITGGANGIGLKTAEHFLHEGAKVVLVDLKEDDLDKAKSALDQHGDVTTIQADVASEEDVERYVRDTVQHHGTIDVFFNNAGVEGTFAPIVEQTVENIDKVFSVNVRGAALGLKHVLPVMTKQQSGSVINTSSVAGLTGNPGLSPYVMSKHAVVGLTKSAALEVADNEVRVNSIHPSPVDTRMMKSIEESSNPGSGDEAKEEFTNAIPLNRYGEASDIAKLVVFLASDDSRFITGAQYRVDGGMGAN